MTNEAAKIGFCRHCGSGIAFNDHADLWYHIEVGSHAHSAEPTPESVIEDMRPSGITDRDIETLAYAIKDLVLKGVEGRGHWDKADIAGLITRWCGEHGIAIDER